ncbi:MULTISPECIES: type IV secretion system protein TraC [Pseudomonas]|uniref:Conjugal transfer ATP-binding protein TraC n=1 Tax=Pseudomonas rhodesiae TaxID=76760 RepID=A0AAE8L2M0_9PSED|nr:MULTISPECIES: type IV secretion system protein TraC [Pseudomonas]EKF8205592.1 type IV secretion system protein TraC [Pseudomonas aeruginosa]MBH8612339.1 type IV secretion system protein TraC [Pseudomonas mohnii]QCO95529.1 F-type type IV secretion, ATPase [Pseudomonas aeruginosa]TWR50700.1 type IV secretion system protein TraC [Pseudomonas rhodesiae]WRU66214.1 type IV secretion system protein TraC [Pseudomonas veronii]
MLKALIRSTPRLSKLINGLAYEPNLYLFQLEGNRLGFAFLCSPLSGSNGDEGDRLKAGLTVDWPEKTTIQFSLICTENINEMKTGFLRLRRAFRESGRTDLPVETQALLEKVTNARAEYFSDRTMRPVDSISGVRIREQSLVVSVTIPIANALPTQTEANAAKELFDGLRTSLDSCNLAAVPLTNDSYREIFSSILNQGPSASWREDPDMKADTDKPLNEQILDYNRSLDVKKDHLQIGDDCFVKTLSAKRFPEVMWQGDASQYLADILSQRGGIRGNCIINMTLYFPPQLETKDKLSKRRQWAINQSFGPMVHFVPVLRKTKEAYDTLFEDLDKGLPNVQATMTLVVFGRNREDLIQAASNAKSHFATQGFSLMEDKFCVLPVFVNSLPMCADPDAMRELFRFKTLSLTQALPLLPIYGDWKGTGTQVAPFISRNGQPVSFNLFDSDTNYNAMIAAQSGSGKSFATNYLITSYLSIGAKVWVIDVGLSYLKLSEAYKGDFARFDQESNLCLNPFELIEDYSEEEDVLVGLLSAMAAPTVPLIDFQTAGLKRHLTQCWEELGKTMIVDNIADSLLGDPDPRIQDIGHQLFAFTSKGQYGRFFNGKNNLNFKNPFTVLELEELKGRQHLQQVVLLQLIYQIQQDMYLGERDRPKIVIIDEAWSLLSQGNVGEFIEHGYRRFRKYGGSAIVITQGVNDLYQNKVGQAIAENSAFTLLLGQKAEAIDAIQENKRLPLGEGGYRILKTVKSYKGHYSEIFMLTPRGAGIVRLTVDPYSILLYSTAPEDVQAIRNYTLTGVPQDEAILRVLRDRGVEYSSNPAEVA